MAHRINRRTLLAGATSGAVALGLPRIPASWARTAPSLPTSPFALGLASGDPTARSVVLWTRLALDGLGAQPLPHERIRVRWELARDERFRHVVRRGHAVASRTSAYSVHVELNGLSPQHEYYYRFIAGGYASPVGRTRTAPHPDHLSTVRMAFISCQHFEQGLYTALAHLAEEDVELVLHLGDFIYEGPGAGDDSVVRHHVGGEAVTLEGYRQRYAQYRSDPNLQLAHARHPFVVTWDDHEVDNNYTGLTAGGAADPAFPTRRAAAYQAYYEHMPLRRPQKPHGPDARLYRRLPYGRLADFTVLDTRQYRSDQACGDGHAQPCAEWGDPSRTVLGPAQSRWLTRTLSHSHARWNVIAQQVPVTAIAYPDGLYQDGWPGYPTARAAFLQTLQHHARNPVVLTGDVHASWACEVNANPQDPASPAVAAEFIGTSISSEGDGAQSTSKTPAVLAANPHVHWYDGRRGYVRCRVTRHVFDADYRIVPFVTQPGAPVQTAASFRARVGAPTVTRTR